MDHTIVHFEIPADDLEKLSKFYAELFGRKIERWPRPSDYLSIATVPINEKGEPIRPGVSGGMMKRQNPQHKPINYILVASVDEYAKKIGDPGGRIIVPKTQVPGTCW